MSLPEPSKSDLEHIKKVETNRMRLVWRHGSLISKVIGVLTFSLYFLAYRFSEDATELKAERVGKIRQILVGSDYSFALPTAQIRKFITLPVLNAS